MGFCPLALLFEQEGYVLDTSTTEISIFADREICWLHELATANGISRDFLTKLVKAGDLEAIDMAPSGTKRRKLAVHRDSWNDFIERRKTVGTANANRPTTRRRRKQRKPKDFLSLGKRKN